MININLIVWMLFAHWVADFVLQSDWMAQNKSKAWFPLYLHCFTYGLAMALFFALSLIWSRDILFGKVLHVISFLNVMIWSHIFVDYFTSRWNRYLWERKEVHLFFVFVGLDQFIHFWILLAVLKVYN